MATTPVNDRQKNTRWSFNRNPARIANSATRGRAETLRQAMTSKGDNSTRTILTRPTITVNRAAASTINAGPRRSFNGEKLGRGASGTSEHEDLAVKNNVSSQQQSVPGAGQAQGRRDRRGLAFQHKQQKR